MKANLLRIVLTISALTTSVYSQTLYWDANGATSGMGGTGSWTNNTAIRWNSAADGSGTGLAWANSNIASFGGTAGTVTTAANNLTPTGLEFTTGGYSLSISNGDGSLVLNGNVSVNTADDNQVTISSGFLRTTVGASNKTFTIGTGDTLSLNSYINSSQTGGIAKAGSGTMILTNGLNNYSGGTAVNAGTLFINNSSGTGAGNGSVTVAAGATLGGSGFIRLDDGETLVNNGIFSPGSAANTTDTFTINAFGTTPKLDFGTGSTLQMSLGTNSDLITFGQGAGNWLSGSGNANLSLTLGTGFSYSNTYTIFQNVTTTGFSFSAITGYDTTNYNAVFGLSGNNYQLSFTAVPEPSTAAILGLTGFFAVVAFLRRRARME